MGVGVVTKAPAKLATFWKDLHWGRRAKLRLRDVEFDDAPDNEIAVMGHLAELGTMDGAKKASRISFGDDAELGIGLDTKRCYPILNREDNDVVRQFFWRGRGTCYLAELAEAVGGKQNAWSYPKVRVSPIGPVDYVIYYTHKKGEKPDSHAYYEHEYGEVTGLRPWLAIDTKGRLWFAGGNYTTTPAGIED